MWKSITVLIISFAILGVISTAQVSFGKMVSKEPHISNIVSDSFSQISRQSDLISVEKGYSVDNDLSNVVGAGHEPKEPHISNIVSDSFSQISRSNETGSDVVR